MDPPSERAQPGIGIALKITSTIVFTIMATLVKLASADYPIGEIMFFRSFFALMPVLRLGRRRAGAFRRPSTPAAASAFLPLARPAPSACSPASRRCPAADRRRHRHRLCRAADDRGARRHLPRREGAHLSLVGGRGRLHRRAGHPVGLCRPGASGVPRAQHLRRGSSPIGGALLGARRLDPGARHGALRVAPSTIVVYFSLFCALAGLVSIPFTPWAHARAARCRHAGRRRHLRRHRPGHHDPELPPCRCLADRARSTTPR